MLYSLTEPARQLQPPTSAARTRNDVEVAPNMLQRRTHLPAFTRLDEQERAEAQRVAARLQESLARIRVSLPEKAQTAAGFAKHLGVKRFSCQELFSALDIPAPGPSTLTRVPGVSALTVIISAMRQRAMDEALVTNFESAVFHFQSFLKRSGGNQRSLAKRLHADESVIDAITGSPPPPLRARGETPEQLHFEITKKLIGCWGRVQISAQIVAPSRTDPDQIELPWAFGICGHTVRWGSPPLVFRHSIGGDEGMQNDLGSEGGAAAQNQILMTEFCTTPNARLTDLIRNGHQIGVFDQPPDIPVDIMTSMHAGMMASHPCKHPTRRLEFWVSPNRPVETLLIDVFVHQSLAKLCTTDVDIHLTQVLQGIQSGERWSTKLPNKPSLRLLGLGLADAETKVYPRQPELLQNLFSKIQWDPNEFVGYRCEISYPLWRMAYRVLLDFSQTTPISSGE